MIKIFFLVVLTFFCSFSIAADFGYNNIDGPILTPPINYTIINQTGNFSGDWVTDSLGSLSDANSTQFIGTSGVLSIKESWLQSLFCSRLGCEIDGDVIVTGNVTAEEFYGTYNWTTEDDWLSFDGSTLSFNESKLNETIDNRAPDPFNDVYTIYFDSSKKNVITYNLTDSDDSIITVETVPGQKEIYGGDFE